MRPFRVLIAIFACAAVISLQFSGLHLHASSKSHTAGLHGAHIHQAETTTHGHEHDADRDVTLFEVLTGSAKHMPFLVALLTVLLFTGILSNTFGLPVMRVVFQSRRQRWRPPLRAPPATP